MEIIKKMLLHSMKAEKLSFWQIMAEISKISVIGRMHQMLLQK